jgi:hypothetical protein
MSILKCEQCGRILFAVNEDGLIQHEHGHVREVHGICGCGRGFHYSVTDRLLERIIERYNQRAEVVE